MKTREEYLAAAEALEWAAGKNRVTIEGKIYDLRDQAAKVPKQEPVAYLYKWSCGHMSLMHDYWNGQYPSESIPLYTHPAPAPTEQKQEPPAYLTVVPDHHDRIVWRNLYYHLREKEGPWLVPAPAPTEHTAADAPSSNAGNLQALKAAKEPSAVGVPDVDAMAAELKRYDAGFGMPVCRQAAEALAALQEQLADSKRSEMWLGNDNDSWKIAHEQQAATIKEMRELLKRAAKGQVSLAEFVSFWERTSK